MALVLHAEEPAVSLADLLRQAKERNPEVQAAFQKWKVVDAEAGAAAVWPNPTLSYSDQKEPAGQAGVDPLTRKSYGVSQDVPFPGKLSNDSRMKRHEALIAEAAYRDTTLKIAGATKIIVYKLGNLERLIVLAEQNEASLQKTLGITQARLAANRGMASDVFMAQMELRRMENMVFEKKQERRSAEIELDVLLDEPMEKTWPGPFEVPVLSDLPLDLPELLALAETNNPQIQSAHHEINHSRSMLARSRLEYAPDFGFSYQYQTAGGGARGTGPAGRQLGLSLSVPLWVERPLLMTAGAAAHIKEAEAEAESMKNMVRKMVAMEQTEVVTHLTLARKIENEILPVAEAGLNSAREQYTSGRGDFMRFLEANRAWINAHVEQEEQIFHTVEHGSELERWVGTDLTAVPGEKNHAK